MLHRGTSAGGRVLSFGTCTEARSLADADLAAAATRSAMAALAEATLAAD